MYTALYRTERPENFDQVLGQDHIVRILRNQVKTGTVGHAYLFCGTRGTGKTSVARILAKAVNCTGEEEGLIQAGGDGKPCCRCSNCQAIQKGNFLDVIEIDAASNNGVDNVRELRESVNYPPSMGKRKVYIIDEAHELTTHALNALLKTLEEPPENVMFILATTDPQKLIQTILSRCLRLDFHRISENELKAHMAQICSRRNVEITEDALNLLSANADGSARDALSLLDQCLSGNDTKLDRDRVLEYLGTVSDDFFIKITSFVESGNAMDAILMLDEVLRDGKDVKQILSDWMGHYRSLLIGKFVTSPGDILNMSGENVARLTEQARNMSLEEINRGIMTLAETVNNARYSPQPRILMELAIVNLAAPHMEEARTAPAPQEASAPVPKPKPAAAPAPQEAPRQKETPSPAPEPTEDPQAAPEKAVAPAAAPEPTPREAPQAAPKEYNLTEIWARVWDVIDDLGSVTMVRLNAKLEGIKDKEFLLLMNNRISLNIAEKNRERLEAAMENIVGRKLKMILREADSKNKDQNSGMQQSLFQSEGNSGSRGFEPGGSDSSGDQGGPTLMSYQKGESPLDDEEVLRGIEDKLNIKLRIEE